MPRDGPVADEARRAQARCPGDPTPDWLLGQYLSQRARADGGTESPGDAVAADAQQQAKAAFDGLARRFPGSLPAITGAADTHLRHLVCPCPPLGFGPVQESLVQFAGGHAGQVSRRFGH
jgi:hypothetical protein